MTTPVLDLHAPASWPEDAWTDVRMEKQYRTFRVFAKAFWDVAEPTARAIWGRHMDAMCDEIQAVIEESWRRRAIGGRILAALGEDADEEEAAREMEAELGMLPPLRLVLLIPPRNSKSTICQRLLPAWIWLHRPTDQILALSGVDTLIERDGLALRDIVKHPQYRAIQAYLVDTGRLPPVPDLFAEHIGKDQSFGMRPDQFAKEKLQNTAGGVRAGHVLGGKYTGVNSDITVIDDPHDVDDGLKETLSPATKLRLMNDVRSTYKDKVQDRLNSPIWGVIILIMQRVHPLDLADYMIEQGATVVCLPARYDPTHPHRYEKDWRKTRGEPLNPMRFPDSVLRQMERASPFGFATKQMMRPKVQEGTRFKRAWMQKRYADDPHDIARACDEVVISVDVANTVGERSDFTSMGVWGRKGARRILLARRYFRGELPRVLAVFDDLCAEWPEASLKLVENKANGTSLIQMRQDAIPGIVPIIPRGDKESRANYATASFEAGNVYLPEKLIEMRETPAGAWEPVDVLNEYIENMVGFGAGGMHDDDVDMTSQVMERWARGVQPWLSTAVRDALAQPRPGIALGDNIIRYDRRDEVHKRIQSMTIDTLVDLYIGIVPGWATGRPGSEAVAVLCDLRGVQVALVEAREGGIETFVTALVHEVAYWGGTPYIRYAELPGMPAPQTALALSRAGLPVGTRARPIGTAYKYAGTPKAGYLGDKVQAPALWAAFLTAAGEGMAVVRDADTLARLETVTEEGGMPSMPDGRPVSGRVLAFLLAVEAAAQARPAAEPEQRVSTIGRAIREANS